MLEPTMHQIAHQELSFKNFIEKALPQSKVCMSNIVQRTSNGKATLAVNNRAPVYTTTRRG